MTEWQTAVNIDSCSLLKKNQAYPPKKVFSENITKATPFCPKISGRGRTELPV